VLYVPEFNELFVANAKDGVCRIFDGQSLRLVGTVDFSDDADNIRYDRAAKLVYVGYGNGALGIIDARNGKRLGEIGLAGHPESFQLETSGTRIFVNVPAAGHIAVIDREKRSVVSKWPLAGAEANFPMTLDETHHRLFVTCRMPPQVIVFDTASGKVVARLPVVGDADDMFYDSSRGRIYVTGGEGFISIIEQRDPDHYSLIAKIPTASGARTSLFVPELGRLYLAVPHRGRQGAEIRVYQAQP
jgi:DNA-binding beta-propeller fold protein YncE